MTTRTSYLVRPVVALVALVAAMAALLIAYNASPVHAAGTCTTTAGTTTCTYGPTGSQDTFEVPLGVSTIHVVATGAPGAEGFMGGTEGAGAQVSGDLTVTPGDTLYVNVGGTPTGGDCYSFQVACIGGFNGGGSSFFGGGGGGASDVRTVSRAEAESLGSRLIVAGGGGGSGKGEFCDTDRISGGYGGHAGAEGGDGTPCEPVPGGTGGGAAPETAGGPGGSPDGGSGSLGLGGNGGDLVGDDLRRGGGGGGGLFGGGGGGGPRRTPDVSDFAPAGGGGGGSNLVPEGGTATLDDSGDPSIAISYQGGLGEEPPTEPEDKQACKKGGYEQFGFKNQGQCIKAVNNAKN